MDRSELETLLTKCQALADTERWYKIIELLEVLPEEDLCPETDNELARAYNSIPYFDENGNGLEAEDVDQEFVRVCAKKSVALLKPHEEYFKGDHCWNYRIADAYYMLEQEGRALHYFEQALEGRPGDEDTTWYIEQCIKRLTAPVFQKSFRERTEEAWDAFEKTEGELRQLIDQPSSDEHRVEIMAICNQVLDRAFLNVSYEVGFNRTKYELVLSPDGSRGITFELVYFKAHAPESVLQHWDIQVGRQSYRDDSLRMYSHAVSAKEVQVWVELKDEGKHLDISLYCPVLLPLFQEDETQVWAILINLTDQIIGEVAAMAYISDFHVLNAPKKEPSIVLSDLQQHMEKIGINTNLTAEEYLEDYTIYEQEALADRDAVPRADVYRGSTRNPQLISDYIKAENDLIDDYQENGVVAGYFMYSLESFSEGERHEAELSEFRESLQNAILEKNGDDEVTFIGEATGLYYGYVDFILWGNLWEFCDSAKDFFENSPVQEGTFCTFRRGRISAMILKDSTETTH